MMKRVRTKLTAEKLAKWREHSKQQAMKYVAQHEKEDYEHTVTMKVSRKLQMPPGCVDVTSQHRGTIFGLIGTDGLRASKIKR